jgi:type II secretory pathway pseudopilin PulG
MQRKDRILKRRGFAMIMAIFFMIIISTLLLYMLSSTTESVQRTTNDYLEEQAVLMAKSATEYAILRVSGYDRTAGGGSCLNSIAASYPTAANPIFNITTNIQYVGFGGINPANNGACVDYISNITTEESNGTMLIDVYVTSDASLNLDEPIRYHRRTLQKL